MYFSPSSWMLLSSYFDRVYFNSLSKVKILIYNSQILVGNYIAYWGVEFAIVLFDILLISSQV